MPGIFSCWLGWCSVRWQLSALCRYRSPWVFKDISVQDVHRCSRSSRDPLIVEQILLHEYMTKANVMIVDMTTCPTGTSNLQNYKMHMRLLRMQRKLICNQEIITNTCSVARNLVRAGSYIRPGPRRERPAFRWHVNEVGASDAPSTRFPCYPICVSQLGLHLVADTTCMRPLAHQRIQIQRQSFVCELQSQVVKVNMRTYNFFNSWTISHMNFMNSSAEYSPIRGGAWYSNQIIFVIKSTRDSYLFVLSVLSEYIKCWRIFFVNRRAFKDVVAYSRDRRLKTRIMKGGERTPQCNLSSSLTSRKRMGGVPHGGPQRVQWVAVYLHRGQCNQETLQ